MQCFKYIIIGVHLKPNSYIEIKRKAKSISKAKASNTYNYMEYVWKLFGSIGGHCHGHVVWRSVWNKMWIFKKFNLT